VLGYERIEKIQNITVGIFVFLGLIALGWLIFKFGDLPSAVSKIHSYDVSVQFASAPGIQKDTPVRFCGYQIGRITGVQPPAIREELRDGQKTGRRFYQSLVIMSIDNQYNQIPANVKIRLMTRGLGSSFIELVVDSNQQALPSDVNTPQAGFLTGGMVLQGEAAPTSEIIPPETLKKIDELINGIMAVVKNTNDVIGDVNNKENLNQSLRNLSAATAEATKAIKQMESFVASANQSSEELSKIMAAFRKSIEKIESGQGTAGKLINDARFYESLLENSKQLKELLNEIQQFVQKIRDKGIKSVL